MQTYNIIRTPKARMGLTTHTSYRIACLNGEKHPLEIENFNYTLVDLGYVSIGIPFGLEIEENSSFNKQQLWAIDNSFDGVYMSDAWVNGGRNVFVYLTQEHATFYKLMANK